MRNLVIPIVTTIHSPITKEGYFLVCCWCVETGNCGDNATSCDSRAGSTQDFGHVDAVARQHQALFQQKDICPSCRGFHVFDNMSSLLVDVGEIGNVCADLDAVYDERKTRLQLEIRNQPGALHDLQVGVPLGLRSRGKPNTINNDRNCAELVLPAGR